MFSLYSFPDILPHKDEVAPVAPSKPEKEPKLTDAQKKKRAALREELKEERAWQSWHISKLSDPKFTTDLFSRCLEPSSDACTPQYRSEASPSLSSFGIFAFMRDHHLAVRERLASRRSGSAALSPEEIADILAEEKSDKLQDLEEEGALPPPKVPRFTSPSLDASVSQIFNFLATVARLNPGACHSALQYLLTLFKSHDPQDFLLEPATTIEPLEKLLSELFTSRLLSFEQDPTAQRLLIGLLVSCAVARGTADSLLKLISFLLTEASSIRCPPPALLSRLVALYHPFLKITSLGPEAATSDVPLSHLPLQHHFLTESVAPCPISAMCTDGAFLFAFAPQAGLMKLVTDLATNVTSVVKANAQFHPEDQHAHLLCFKGMILFRASSYAPGIFSVIDTDSLTESRVLLQSGGDSDEEPKFGVQPSVFFVDQMADLLAVVESVADDRHRLQLRYFELDADGNLRVKRRVSISRYASNIRRAAVLGTVEWDVALSADQVQTLSQPQLKLRKIPPPELPDTAQLYQEQYAAIVGTAHATYILNRGGATTAIGNPKLDGFLSSETYKLPTRLPLLAGQVVKQIAFSSPLAQASASTEADSGHALFLLESGEVLSFGQNNVGQLGHGTTRKVSLPKPISDLSAHRVTYVAAYANKSAAVTADGLLFTWGLDSGRGELGQSSSDFAAHKASLATKSPASSSAFGGRGRGRKKGGKSSSSSSPDDLPALCSTLPLEVKIAIPDVESLIPQIASVTLSEFHTVALTLSHHLLLWGSIKRSSSSSHVATLLPLAEDQLPVAIAAGHLHSLILLDNGTVLGYGSNHAHQLGIPELDFAASPMLIPELSAIKQISSVSNSSAALDADGSAFVWGLQPDMKTPHRISEIEHVTSIQVGTQGTFHLLYNEYPETPDLHLDTLKMLPFEDALQVFIPDAADQGYRLLTLSAATGDHIRSDRFAVPFPIQNPATCLFTYDMMNDSTIFHAPCSRKLITFFYSLRTASDPSDSTDAPSDALQLYGASLLKDPQFSLPAEGDIPVSTHQMAVALMASVDAALYRENNPAQAVELPDDPSADSSSLMISEPLECCRFGSYTSGWGYSGSPDAISFAVSEPIWVLGIGCLGGRSNDFTVRIELREGSDSSSGTVLGSHIFSFTSSDSSIVPVMFEEPISIDSNITYAATMAVTSGSAGYYGNDGMTTVTSNGITFHFSSCSGNNGTSTSSGQIPKIFFQTNASIAATAGLTGARPRFMLASLDSVLFQITPAGLPFLQTVLHHSWDQLKSALLAPSPPSDAQLRPYSFLFVACLRLLRRFLTSATVSPAVVADISALFHQLLGSALMFTIKTASSSPMMTSILDEFTQTFTDGFVSFYPAPAHQVFAITSLIQFQLLVSTPKPRYGALDLLLASALSAIDSQPASVEAFLNTETVDLNSPPDTLPRLQSIFYQKIQAQVTKAGSGKGKSRSAASSESPVSLLVSLLARHTPQPARYEVPGAQLLLSLQRLIIKSMNAVSVPKVKAKEGKAKRHDGGSGSWGYGSSADCVVFKSSQAVSITGFGLFGGAGHYDVEIRLISGASSDADESAFLSTADVSYDSEKDSINQAMFPAPVPIEADAEYVAYARVRGPRSQSIRGGVSSVTTDDGILFTFSNVRTGGNNGTSSTSGQIPEILYQLATPAPEEAPPPQNEDKNIPYINHVKLILSGLLKLVQSALPISSSPSSSSSSSSSTTTTTSTSLSTLSTSPLATIVLPFLLSTMTPSLISAQVTNQILPELFQFLKVLQSHSDHVTDASGTALPSIVKVESPHSPYPAAGFLERTLSFDPAVSFMLVEFDQRSHTLALQDRLSFYADPQRTKLLAGPFSGAFTENWPKTSIIIPGNTVTIFFSASGSQEEQKEPLYGFACSVYGFPSLSHSSAATQMAQELAYTIGKISANHLRQVAIDETQVTALKASECSTFFSRGCSLSSPILDYSTFLLPGTEIPIDISSDSQFMKDLLRASEDNTAAISLRSWLFGLADLDSEKPKAPPADAVPAPASQASPQAEPEDNEPPVTPQSIREAAEARVRALLDNASNAGADNQEELEMEAAMIMSTAESAAAELEEKLMYDEINKAEASSSAPASVEAPAAPLADAPASPVAAPVPEAPAAEGADLPEPAAPAAADPAPAAAEDEDGMSSLFCDPDNDPFGDAPIPRVQVLASSSAPKVDGDLDTSVDTLKTPSVNSTALYMFVTLIWHSGLSSELSSLSSLIASGELTDPLVLAFSTLWTATRQRVRALFLRKQDLQKKLQEASQNDGDSAKPKDVKARKQEIIAKADPVEKIFLGHLQQMGYPLELCSKALTETGNKGVDQALDWILTNADFSFEPAPAASAPTETPAPAPAPVEEAAPAAPVIVDNWQQLAKHFQKRIKIALTLQPDSPTTPLTLASPEVQEHLDALFTLVSSEEELDPLQSFLKSQLQLGLHRLSSLRLIMELFRSVNPGSGLEEAISIAHASLLYRPTPETPSKHVPYPIAPHPLADLHYTLPTLKNLLRTQIYQFLDLLAEIFQTLPAAAPSTPLLRDLITRVWFIEWSEEDFAFLVRSPLLPAITEILSNSPASSALSDASHFSKTQPLVKLSAKQFSLAATHNPGELPKLFDPSTSSCWEADTRSADITIRPLRDLELSAIRQIAIFIDGTKDGNRIPKSISLFAGTHSDYLNRISGMKVESKFSGWILLPIPEHALEDANQLKLTFNSASSVLKIRSIELFGADESATVPSGVVPYSLPQLLDETTSHLTSFLIRQVWQNENERYSLGPLNLLLQKLLRNFFASTNATFKSFQAEIIEHILDQLQNSSFQVVQSASKSSASTPTCSSSDAASPAPSSSSSVEGDASVAEPPSSSSSNAEEDASLPSSSSSSSSVAADSVSNDGDESSKVETSSEPSSSAPSDVQKASSSSSGADESTPTTASPLSRLEAILGLLVNLSASPNGLQTFLSHKSTLHSLVDLLFHSSAALQLPCLQLSRDLLVSCTPEEATNNICGALALKLLPKPDCVSLLLLTLASTFFKGIHVAIQGVSPPIDLPVLVGISSPLAAEHTTLLLSIIQQLRDSSAAWTLAFDGSARSALLGLKSFLPKFNQPYVDSPKFWLAIGALAFYTQSVVTVAYSIAQLCDNHDDGITEADVRCSNCPDDAHFLCRECDQVLHLSRKTRSHERQPVQSSDAQSLSLQSPIPGQTIQVQMQDIQFQLDLSSSTLKMIQIS